MSKKDKHTFHRCPVCEASEKIIKGQANEKPRKFSICTDGYHAICCECSYRIEIHNTIYKEVKS